MTALPIDPEISYRLSRRSTLIVLAFGISLLAAGIGGGVVLTRHEVLAAEPAREMLLFNQWIIPHFVGVPRLVKPPTMGWCIALAMKITGSTADWVPRLPAMLAGVTVGYALARLGARFCGDLIGLLAGLMQLSSVYLLMQARLAEADMPLAACVTVAMAVFAVANLDGPVPRDSKQTRLSCLFYFCVGLGCLFKGPVALLFTLPACAVYAAIARDRRVVKFLLNPAGLVILLLVASSWYLVAAKVYPDIVEVWKAEIHDRTTGEGELTGGVQPWHFYLWTVLWLVMPWTPLIVVGCFAWGRDNRLRAPIARFLLLWFGVGMLLLSLSAWKHKHYIIPALPPLSIPAAIGLLVWIKHQHSKPLIAWQYGLAIGLYGAICSVAIIVIVLKVKVAAIPIAIVVGILLFGGKAVLWCEALRRTTLQIIAIFLTTWFAVLATMLGVMRYHDAYRPSAVTGRLANDITPAGETIYLIGLKEAHVAYYTRFPMTRIDDDSKAAEVLPKQGSPTFALTRASSVDKLRAVGDVEVVARCSRVSREETDDDLLTFVRIVPSR